MNVRPPVTALFPAPLPSAPPRAGGVWPPEKAGLVPAPPPATTPAPTGRAPGDHSKALPAELGTPCSTRIDAPATPAKKARLGKLAPEAVTAATLAGEPITAKLTKAPGNGAAIGGLKVVAANGWFAARPSGTEDIYKIYAESFRDEAHLKEIVAEAQRIVSAALVE